MSLMDWFSALAKGDERSAEAARSGAIAQEATIDGLDFVAAIEAHRKWKERLTAYVQGASSEKLDYRTICRDDQCALGKWIHGTGGGALGALPIFHHLKAKHAQFHVTASRIVELAQDADKQPAQALLNGSEYGKASIEVQMLLSRLYGEMQRARAAA